MKTSISSISTLFQGYHFRGAIPETEDGTLGVVQMSNIDQFARTNATRLAKINFDPKYEKHLLRPGDLIFLGRGSRNTASVVGAGFPPAVPASYFTVIRITCKEILPQYLAIYLNLNETQKRIRELARGTALAVIPVSELANLEIDIPPLETQRTMIELSRLLSKADELESKIYQKRSVLVEAMIGRFFE